MLLLRINLTLLCCGASAACTPAQWNAAKPETVGVSIGGGMNFDRDERSNPSSPRGVGFDVHFIPVWRIKPAPIAKVSDTTPLSQR